MLVNLTRCMRYWDDLSVTQLLVSEMHGASRERQTSLQFKVRRLCQTCPCMGGLPVLGTIGCLEK